MILPLNAADVPRMLEIERACFSDPWTARMFADEFAYGASYFGAFDAAGTQLLGYAGVSSVLDEGELRNIAVAPGAQRRGVASELLSVLLSSAAENGVSVMYLEVRAGNAPAIGLYEKFGFERVGLRRNYYVRPREDAILMRKLL
jgi:ribosomal-protein-alanine N-acetyltransferase